MITEDEIVRNLQRWVGKRGFTYRGLAYAARCDESMISKIMSGRRHIKAVEIAAFAEVLDISTDTLLTSHERVVDRLGRR